jgi:hypothetical protein
MGRLSLRTRIRLTTVSALAVGALTALSVSPAAAQSGASASGLFV